MAKNDRKFGTNTKGNKAPAAHTQPRRHAAPPATAESAPASKQASAEAPSGDSSVTTLNKIAVQKNGYIRYSSDTVRGSVFVTANMFPEGQIPETLDVGATFEAPKAGKSVDPAKAAERAQKATERLSKAQERAAKATERAQKAQERAKKIQDKLAGKTPATPAEGASEQAAPAQ